jgi:hypothetical protein
MRPRSALRRKGQGLLAERALGEVTGAPHDSARTEVAVLARRQRRPADRSPRGRPRR